ncbi:hypothetical protein G6F50_017719 [Rhizopus delemar]|uniref:Uncharacterized protein n=1 Tax=Rhizopus delemar TaxID=936053 RepID=A0A9P7C076_9FUNG|nr:hypothetical protein G6F50_017719 [Rhizopus delemar]
MSSGSLSKYDTCANRRLNRGLTGSSSSSSDLFRLREGRPLRPVPRILSLLSLGRPRLLGAFVLRVLDTVPLLLGPLIGDGEGRLCPALLLVTGPSSS